MSLHVRRWIPTCLSLALLSSFLFVLSCRSEGESSKTTAQKVSAQTAPEFQEIYGILTASCMPCHNRETLPQVIDKVKTASFQDIDGETRLRILGELEELAQYMKDGMPISFTGEQELHRFFAVTPGEFYMMLEKGMMPPPWAHAMFEKIEWPGYKTLGFEERVRLMQYAKPHSEKYLR